MTDQEYRQIHRSIICIEEDISYRLDREGADLTDPEIQNLEIKRNRLLDQLPIETTHPF